MYDTFFAILPGTYVDGAVIPYNIRRDGYIPQASPYIVGQYTGVMDIRLIRSVVRTFENRIGAAHYDGHNTKRKAPESLVMLTFSLFTDVGYLIHSLARDQTDVEIYVKVVESILLTDPAFKNELDEEKTRQVEIKPLRERLAALEAKGK